MLGGWLRRKTEPATIKGAREELERFVESLRAMSDEEIGAVVGMAALVRTALRQSGLLPGESITVTPDSKQATTQLAVLELIQSHQTEQRHAEAVGAMVWLHSLRALSIPEVRLLGRQMWGQLERGQPHALAALQNMGIPPLSDVIFECSRFPEELHPTGTAG
jgi:hypothetical protein